MKNKKINDITIRFSEHPADWLVKQHFYNTFSDAGIKLKTDSNLATSILNINIKQIEIQYLIYENDNDTLVRKAVVSIDGNLINDSNIEIIENKIHVYNDKIARKDIDFIKSDNAFANAPVPEKNKTFFEEFAVPIIVVTSAILTVVILFTVRSG